MISKSMLLRIAAIAPLLFAGLAFAYTTFQNNVSGAATPSRWPNGSVVWQLNPTIGSNIDTISGTNAVPVTTVLNNAFQTWHNAQWNGQALSSVTFTQGPNSGQTDPDLGDCSNVISFVPSAAVSFSTGTLAVTMVTTAYGPVPSTYTCTVNGQQISHQTSLVSQITDADIVFNPQITFSTATPAQTGEYDLQAVASHEVGHLLGLEHDGIAHAMMYPFGDTGANEQRVLWTDDIMGLAFLYPTSAFATATGTVSGSVSLAGTAVFAAHVLAVDKTTGLATVDALTNPDGTFRLTGVPPGNYRILSLPLTGAYTVNDFGGWTCGFATNPQNCSSTPTANASFTGTYF